MWCGTRGFAPSKLSADLERIQRRACRTLNRIGMLLASVIWSTWKIDVKSTAKKLLRVYVTMLEHVISYPLQDFSLMVEIWEIHQICPNTAWKPFASETAPCLTLFRFWTKPNPFSRTAVCFILTIFFFFRSIVSGCPWACWRMLMQTFVPWPEYAALPLCTNCPAHCAPMVDPIADVAISKRPLLFTVWTQLRLRSHQFFYEIFTRKQFLPTFAGNAQAQLHFCG